MGRREHMLAKPVYVYRYDCDGCGAQDTIPYSRIQFGQVNQSGQDFRRYLCDKCTKHLRGFLRRRAEICR